MRAKKTEQMAKKQAFANIKASNSNFCEQKVSTPANNNLKAFDNFVASNISNTSKPSRTSRVSH